MPNVPKFSREQMWITLAAFGVVAVLAVLKVDTTAFIGLALAVLGGLGIVHLSNTKSDIGEVKTQVNGNNQRLVSAVMVALAHAPADKAPEILAQLGLSGVLPTGAAPPPLIPAQREPLDAEVTAVE